jgi:hypothetical protein
MPVTYEPIATQTLSVTTSIPVFTAIPQTYTDLVVVTSGQAAVTGDDFAVVYFNNDGASNYSTTQLYTINGTSAASSRTGSTTGIFSAPLNLASTGTYGICSLYIFNYSNTTTFKTVISRDNSLRAGLNTGVGVGTWRSTAAISSIYLRTINGYGWASGSTLTLYGIKAA